MIPVDLGVHLSVPAGVRVDAAATLTGVYSVRIQRGDRERCVNIGRPQLEYDGGLEAVRAAIEEIMLDRPQKTPFRPARLRTRLPLFSAKARRQAALRMAIAEQAERPRAWWWWQMTSNGIIVDGESAPSLKHWP